jgi:GGDEF domain-containing protein
MTTIETRTGADASVEQLDVDPKVRRHIPFTVMGVETTPCAQPCEPFAGYCELEKARASGIDAPIVDAVKSLYSVMGMIAAEDAVKIAQGFCTNEARMQTLHAEIENIKSTALFWQMVSEKLSFNNNTGLIEGSALPMIIEKLYDSGMIEQYISEGYRMQIIYADLDDLKMLHNERAGGNGHEDGDKAIATFGKAFAECFGRTTDISMLLVDPSDEFEVLDMSQITSRSNLKGDEYVSICFVKDEVDRQASTAEETLKRIEAKLLDLSYESNGERHSVTATLAIIDAEIPKVVDGFYAVHNLVDRQCTQYKAVRKAARAESGDKLVTSGIVVDISK